MTTSDQSNQYAVRRISVFVGVMVGFLALASFTLSFEALRQLAVKKGVVVERLSWIFPLVVDGGIIVFSLAALRSSLRRESARWLSLLVVIVTIASVYFNMCHVEQDWLARGLASVPPILLFLSLEVLFFMIRKEIHYQTTNTTEAIEEKPLSKEARIAQIKSLLHEGLSSQEIADQIPSVSMRTVQRDIRHIEKTD